MGDVGKWFSDKWSQLTGKTPQQTVDPFAKALPSGPDMGTAPEPAGMTSGGGRRFTKMKGKKTRKSHKKSRKTRRH